MLLQIMQYKIHFAYVQRRPILVLFLYYLEALQNHRDVITISQNTFAFGVRSTSAFEHRSFYEYWGYFALLRLKAYQIFDGTLIVPGFIFFKSGVSNSIRIDNPIKKSVNIDMKIKGSTRLELYPTYLQFGCYLMLLYFNHFYCFLPQIFTDRINIWYYFWMRKFFVLIIKYPLVSKKEKQKRRN